MKIAERPRCRKCGRSMVKTRDGAFICYICGEWFCPADYKQKWPMNNIDEMMPICHDCPYWEVCEPPYVCAATEAKYRKNDKGENNTKEH